MSLRQLSRLAALLLTLAVAALVWRVAAVDWQTWRRTTSAAGAVAELRLALRAAEMVSRERGLTNAALGDPSPTPPAQALAQARQRSDQALDQLAQVLAPGEDDASGRDAAQHLVQARQALQQARAQVDAMLAQPLADRTAQALRERVLAMAAVVPLLAPAAGLTAGQAQHALPALSDDVQAARLSAELREYAGLLGSHFTAALTRQQPFSAEERAAIERTRGRIDELRFLIELRVAGQPSAVQQAWQLANQRYFDEAGAVLAGVIASGEGDGRYGLDPAGFAARYVPLMDSLLALRDVLLNQATQAATQAHREARQALQVLVSLAVVAALVMVTAALVFHRRVLVPLADTATALQALAANAVEVRLPQPRGQDEVSTVVLAVHALQRHARRRLQLEAERDELIRQLRDQSNTDFLTALPNRRAFFEAAERELAQAQRHGHGMVVVLLDLDRFKQLNDTHGHAAGDQALVALAGALRRALRQGDLVARYGGEEFVVLLNHSDLAAGLRFAERLREAIAALSVRGADGRAVHLSASLGVCDSARHGHHLMPLLSLADAAMYAAKQAGRNRVQAA